MQNASLGVTSLQDADRAVHAAEKRLFWWALYITQGAWGFFAVTAIIKLYWGYLVRSSFFFEFYLFYYGHHT